jgi:hypothetical protein
MEAIRVIVSFEQISLDASTAKPLSPPAGCHKAIVQAETANVRLRMDGTAPTSSIGEILVASGAVRELHATEVYAAKFISSSGSAKINVHYYRTS